MSIIVYLERAAHDLGRQLDALRAELDRVTKERDEALTLWRTADRYALQAQIDAARARVEKLEAALRSLLKITVPIKAASPSWAVSEIDMIVRRALEGE